MKSFNFKFNAVVIFTLVYLKSNQSAAFDVNNINKLWSLTSANRGARTLIPNADRRNVQRLNVVPNKLDINLVNANGNNISGGLIKTNTIIKQESLENRNTSRHKNYRKNRLITSEEWMPRSIPLNYNQEFQPQIENSLKVFDNENDKSEREYPISKENKKITNYEATETSKNIYTSKEPELANTAIPIIIKSNSYLAKPIPLLKDADNEWSQTNTPHIVPVNRVEPNLPMKRSFLDLDDDSDYDEEPEYSKVKRKHAEGEDVEEEEDSTREDYDPEGLEKKGKPKIKKKYIKYMLPLLLAYKLKFFTLIPLLMGGLVLLTGATGMAGFFFALFAAVMGLKSGH